MAATRRGAIEQFRNDVELGNVRDKYGNRFCMYTPRRDTLFSCLSHTQCGNESLAGQIRERLLCALIERVTGVMLPVSAHAWRRTTDINNFAVSPRCVADPAIKSLAMTCGGHGMSNSDMNEWIAGSAEFRAGVLEFIDRNLVVGIVYCRFVFAYLYCAVYDSDVTFYSVTGRPEAFEVTIEHSICKINGVARSVLTTQSERRVPTSLRLQHDQMNTPRHAGSASDDDSSVSDNEMNNWHTAYLLHIADEQNAGRFELMYTPNVDPDMRVTTRRRGRYQIRTCWCEGDRGRLNESPKRGHPAMMVPPPLGWKVHSYLLDPDELYPERIYQVNSSDLHGITRHNLPASRTLFVYLYYQNVGGQPLAVFVQAVGGGANTTCPLFAIQDEVAGDADGVLVTAAKSANYAHIHVQKETQAVVKIPGLGEDR